jgi:hypothetical protein
MTQHSLVGSYLHIPKDKTLNFPSVKTKNLVLASADVAHTFSYTTDLDCVNFETESIVGR